MKDYGKVVILESVEEVRNLFLDEARVNPPQNFVAECNEELLKRGVIGYYKNKVAIFRSSINEEARREKSRNVKN